MKPYKGMCKECGEDKWIRSSTGLCDICIFKRNHGGKSKEQIYKERSKPKKVHYIKSSNKRKEVLSKDRETYYQVFISKPNYCEECYLNGVTTMLPEQFEDNDRNILMISQYSHILSKSAFPEFRHNPENFNRLCLKHHSEWEFFSRDNMKIYTKNQEIIRKLKNNF